MCVRAARKSRLCVQVLCVRARDDKRHLFKNAVYTGHRTARTRVMWMHAHTTYTHKSSRSLIHSITPMDRKFINNVCRHCTRRSRDLDHVIRFLSRNSAWALGWLAAAVPVPNLYREKWHLYICILGHCWFIWVEFYVGWFILRFTVIVC